MHSCENQLRHADAVSAAVGESLEDKQHSDTSTVANVAAAHAFHEAGDDFTAAAAEQPHALSHNEWLRQELRVAGNLNSVRKLPAPRCMRGSTSAQGLWCLGSKALRRRVVGLHRPFCAMRAHQLGAAQHVLRQLLRAKADGNSRHAARGQQRLHIHAHAVQRLQDARSAQRPRQ